MHVFVCRHPALHPQLWNGLCKTHWYNRFRTPSWARPRFGGGGSRNLRLHQNAQIPSSWAAAFQGWLTLQTFSPRTDSIFSKRKSMLVYTQSSSPATAIMRDGDQRQWVVCYSNQTAKPNWMWIGRSMNEALLGLKWYAYTYNCWLSAAKATSWERWKEGWKQRGRVAWEKPWKDLRLRAISCTFAYVFLSSLSVLCVQSKAASEQSTERKKQHDNGHRIGINTDNDLCIAIPQSQYTPINHSAHHH